ncbi:sigma-54 dependent transcriptional regulator [bacterium]|nr:sigma-54 dependent transcriptional regulator [bacterium]
MKELLTLARRYGQDRTMPVLIEGETGTGKEIIARIIHHEGNVSDAPFVAINCPAISAGLFESELFGYESGAFTGARKAGQLGKFEFSGVGTVFLDEIGDLPMEMQPKLLRVLQERTFYRVGGLRRVELRAKVICATNQNLASLVGQGQFREDLFYRLNIGKITIPPLRERPEEILPLARMFLARSATARKREFRDLSERTEKLLLGYAWPGNVRELKNVIERAVLLYDGPRLEPEHLAFDRSGQRAGAAVAEAAGDGDLVIPLSGSHLDIDQVEAQVLREVLAKFKGNKSQASAFLGITPSSLRRKLRRLSVPDSF